MDKYQGVDFAALVAKHKGITAAAKATGIPRTTIQSRLEQADVAVSRIPVAQTIVPLAEPANAKS